MFMLLWMKQLVHYWINRMIARVGTRWTIGSFTPILFLCYTYPMRLDKLLELSAVGSKNQVKKLIRSQAVTIDASVAKSGSQNVDSGLQKILVNGKEIRSFAAAYFILNKPSGVVTARSDANHQTVIDMIKPEDMAEGLYPVGRLDRDTEGLVLLTNNGPLGFRMLHPKHHVSKEYFVTVNGFLGEDAITLFKEGLVFPDGKKCRSSDLRIINQGAEESSAYLTISEGKFHQVKKMFLTYGLKVIFLKRTSFAGIELGDLTTGDYRQLSHREKQIIKSFLE